jgi:hypothetical protein
MLLGGKYTHRSGVTMIGEFYSPSNTPRQHHGYIRVSKSRLRELPGWKEWDVAASLVANLDDGSRIAVFDAGRRFGNHYYTYTHVQAPAGKRWRSQYGMISCSALVSVGIRLQM